MNRATITDPGLTLAGQLASRPTVPTTRRRSACPPRRSLHPPQVERPAAVNPTTPRSGHRRHDPIGFAEFAVVLAISLCPPALLAWGIQRGVGR